MNNNTWEEADLYAIIEIAREVKMFEHNGLMIIITHANGKDPMMSTVHDMIDACGGAACVAFDLGFIKELLVQSDVPVPMADFVIAHSYGDEYPIVVLMKESLLKDKYADQLPFVLAHEIGHVVNGDTAKTVLIKSQSKEVQERWEQGQLERECLADQFASTLLGSTAMGLYSLNYIQEHLLSEKGDVIKEESPSSFDDIINSCKVRIANLNSI